MDAKSGDPVDNNNTHDKYEKDTLQHSSIQLIGEHPFFAHIVVSNPGIELEPFKGYNPKEKVFCQEIERNRNPETAMPSAYIFRLTNVPLTDTFIKQH